MCVIQCGNCIIPSVYTYLIGFYNPLDIVVGRRKPELKFRVRHQNENVKKNISSAISAQQLSGKNLLSDSQSKAAMNKCLKNL